MTNFYFKPQTIVKWARPFLYPIDFSFKEVKRKVKTKE